MKKIIVLFKTHLDVGFTDFSANVVQNYMDSFIPQALNLARSMRGQEERFVWTTGSWLIAEFLKQASPEMRRRMEEAISLGEIAWHGLPFTTHTELMDRDLFRYGLGISQKLDRRFGVRTIGAKMTDVPGHTRAMVPELARAGIRFLHIGVNAASSVPEVPTLFRWQWDSGEEVLVMYNSAYGSYTEIPGTDTAVYFAHTNDNLGPQKEEEVVALYRKLHEQYPDAEIRAGTLNDLAEAAMCASGLPVIRAEIGDSWIHGVGSDPEKVRQYRELLRVCREFPDEVREDAYRELLLIPEHTWGLDVKTHLGTFGQNGQGEHRYYLRSEFEAARSGEKFRKMEQSWKEQRGYAERAAAVISAKTGKDCKAMPVSFPDFSGWEKLPLLETVSIEEYAVQFDRTGSICLLKNEQKIFADGGHKWGELLYQAFSAEDYKQFQDAYITNRFDWALEDFGKIGMEKAGVTSQILSPRLAALYRNKNRLAALVSFDGQEHEKLGAPAKAALVYTLEHESIGVELIWTEKPANRLPEALWLGFSPVGEKVSGISKLARWIDPANVVQKGGRKLHATDYGVRLSQTVIETLDCPLVNIGKPALLRFDDSPIPVEDGVFFNLYNNVWGTNFVMWYEEDASFRFWVKLDGLQYK